MRKIAHRGGAETNQLHPSSRLEKLSWDDLKVFLVCVDSPSFREAARILKTSHSTIVRRIERLECVLEVELFQRLPEGGVVTSEGVFLAERARAMYNSLCELERERSSREFGQRGEVSIAVTEGLGSFWVMPQLVEFQRQNPLTQVNLFCAMESVDVLRLEADMAIQFLKPSRPELIALKLGCLHIFPFASRRYLEIFGVPKDYGDMIHHRLVEQVAPQIDSSALARYFKLDDPKSAVGIRTNTSTAHLYAIEKGAGIGGLPTFASALGAQVVPVDIGNGYSLDIWLAYHPDSRRSSHKAAAIQWIKRIFDPATFPWFRNQFIHPTALNDMVPEQAAANRDCGNLAVSGCQVTDMHRGEL